MIEFHVVQDPESAERFRKMTFQAHRHLLSFEALRASTLAIGVTSDHAAVGLALASRDPNSPVEAELLSIFVERDFRGRGLSNELLQRLERHAAANGIQKLAGTYMTGQATTAALEAALRRTGWSAPQTRMLVVRCSLDSVRDAPWLKHFRLPTGYSILRWSDVSSAERDEIRNSQLKKPWIPHDLVPFDHEGGAEPETSLALRVDGRIQGWCLNHVVDGILRFTCSFVHPRLQRLGRILLLSSESVARAPRIGMSVAMWTIPVWHPAMRAFAERNMRPYAIFFAETRRVEKKVDA